MASFHFETEGAESRYVQPGDDGFPDDVAALVRQVQDADLQVVLRYTPNEFDLPFFLGYVLEASDHSPVSISSGIGLHLDRSIAAVRALAEAAQSRLTTIHGGRDDLVDRYDRFAGSAGREHELRVLAALRERTVNATRVVTFDSVPSVPAQQISSIFRRPGDAARKARQGGDHPGLSPGAHH